MGFSIWNLLFEVNDEYNRVNKHNYNFKCTQSIRLTFMIVSALIWICLFYVWARGVFAEIQFWILLIWIYAISCIAVASGREVVQQKMLNKIKEDKLKDGAIQPEQVDELELPEEDKSDQWKGALISYSVAMPLILASPIMYYLYSDNMFKGEVCNFYQLAMGEESALDECILNYADKEDYYIEKAGFRYTVFQAGIFVPIIFAVVEFFQNQLLISWKHIVYQYIFTANYALLTFIVQRLYGGHIYPGELDWDCTTRTGAVDGCIFKESWLWFIVFAAVQTGCYAIVLFLHYIKAKFCCKVSVRIDLKSTVDADDFKSITTLSKMQ